jgi:hypothetical protein
VLAIVNVDIFHYSNTYNIERTFLQDIDSGGENTLINSEILKKGDYSIKISGETTDSNNGYIIYVDNEPLISGKFPEGNFNELLSLRIEENTRQIRISADYDPNSSSFMINKIVINSDYVLYKDSLIRHFVVDLCLIFVFIVLLLRFSFPEYYNRIFRKISKPSTERILLFLILLTIFTGAPLYNGDYVQTNDGYYHMVRIEGIKESLEAGYIPARIHLFALNDYGYGEGFYYPDLFLYFPAILRLLGFNILTSYKIFIFICSFLAILNMYLAVSRIVRSRYAGLISAVLFAFAAYRLIDIYYRGAVGELLSFIFIPLVFWGLFEIYGGSPQRWGIFALGITGLIFSHMISLAIVCSAVFIFVMFNIADTLKHPRIFTSILKAICVSVIFSAVFWLPLIEQLIMNDVIGDVLYTTVSYPIDSERLVSIPELFAGFANWDQIKPYMGYALLFVPFLRIMVRKSGNKSPGNIKIADYFLIFGIVTTLAVTPLFPWKFFPWFYNRIQFPWRILLLASPLLAAAGGILGDILFQKHDRMLFLAATVCFCAVSSMQFFTEVMTNRIVPGDGFRLENNRVMGAEYLPINADTEFVDKNKNTVLSSDSTFENLDYDRSGLSYSFDFRLSSETDTKVTFEVPLLFYSGYKASLSEIDGKQEELKVYQGAHGLTSVDVSGVKEGRLLVYYSKTRIQKIADMVGFFSALLVIILFYIKRRKNRNGKKTDVVDWS